MQPFIRTRKHREPSRLFDNVDDVWSVASALLTPPGISVSFWAWPDEATGISQMFNISSGGVDRFVNCSLRGDVVGDPLRLGYKPTVAAATNLDTGNAFTASAWNHCVISVSTAGALRVRLNGGTAATGTNSSAFTAPALTTTMWCNFPTQTNFFGGLLFWPCVWNVALEAADELNLYEGVPPWEIRPESIVSMPNMNDGWDDVWDKQFTMTGSQPAAPYKVWTVRRRGAMVQPVVAGAVKGSLTLVGVGA